MSFRWLRWTVPGLLAVAAWACASGPELTEDGVPTWVDRPCDGFEQPVLCAVGESDLAAADVEAGKTDAETAAKNRIADQIQARVGRLTERLSSAMKDLANGKTYGEHTLKDINRNFSEVTLSGLRYTDYYYLPDRLNPQKVWVRAMVSVDTNRMSEEIASAMLQSAAKEKLEYKHEAAQQRFDAVRREYLRDYVGE